MSDELELKAVIPDPDALRERLRASGGRERFRARMNDVLADRPPRPSGSVGLPQPAPRRS